MSGGGIGEVSGEAIKLHLSIWKSDRQWNLKLFGKVNTVVYRLCPTSNHNGLDYSLVEMSVVYRLCPTSNHNLKRVLKRSMFVVYRLCPTSNHNLPQFDVVVQLLYIAYVLHQTTTVDWWGNCCEWLYIAYVLHQTTTPPSSYSLSEGCISLMSYIKPQHDCMFFDC